MQMIVVFPDGETWSTLNGCRLFVIKEEDFLDICEDNKSLKRQTPAIEVDLNRLISSIHPKILKENG